MWNFCRCGCPILRWVFFFFGFRGEKNTIENYAAGDFTDGTQLTSTRQHTNTSIHQHIINTSTHQHINTSTHQHINTSTHQHNYQHINTSTHQHSTHSQQEKKTEVPFFTKRKQNRRTYFCFHADLQEISFFWVCGSECVGVGKWQYLRKKNRSSLTVRWKKQKFSFLEKN